jgi:hypothetical protein
VDPTLKGLPVQFQLGAQGLWRKISQLPRRNIFAAHLEHVGVWTRALGPSWRKASAAMEGLGHTRLDLVCVAISFCSRWLSGAHQRRGRYPVRIAPGFAMAEAQRLLSLRVSVYYRCACVVAGCWLAGDASRKSSGSCRCCCPIRQQQQHGVTR